MKLPGWSLTQPIIAGPAKPPRLPIELMVAMPVAAAAPDRNRVGMLHSGGLAQLIPTLTSVRAAIRPTMLLAPAATTSPIAAARQARMTCQVRSPVRSEWRDHSTMAITETIGGMAFRKPTVMDETPSCLMICGAQMPRVYKPAEVPK